MSADTGKGAEQRRPKDDDLEELLERIWDGKSLRTACSEMGLHVPSTSTWLDNDDDRREQYARAREGRAEVLQEEALTVTKASALGKTVENKKVEPSGARAYLEAVKWANARMAPKKEPAQRHEHTGAGGGPIEYANMSREQRRARIEELQARRAGRSGGA